MMVRRPLGQVYPLFSTALRTRSLLSLTAAAGRPTMCTVIAPITIASGAIGHTHISVIRAAGSPPIKVVAAALTIISGIAGWATGVGTGAGGWMGAWQWGLSCNTRSVRRAAGFDMGTRIN